MKIMVENSKTARKRLVNVGRFLAVLLVLLTIGIGNAWGAETSCTLSNANILGAGDPASGYNDWSFTDGCSQTWSAYCIKNKQSNADADYNHIQIKAYTGSTAYYLQVPAKSGYTIKSITMVVSSTTAVHNGGGNTATYYFSSSNNSNTAAEGLSANPATAVSATGASSVTLNCSSLGLTTGYITASAGTRMWGDITVTYESTSSDPYTVTYNAEGGTCGTSSETEASAGAGVTLPDASPSAECDSEGWALYGWATSACSPATGTAPTIVGKAGETYYPSDDITLHAVYAKGEYTKITSTGDLTSGSKYLIAVNYSSKNYILKSSSSDYNSTSYTMASAQVDETSGKYHAKDVDNSWCYTIEGSTDSWRIRDVVNATDNYLDIAYESWWGKAYDEDDPYKITVSEGVWSLNCHYYYNSAYYDTYLSFDETDKLFKADESAYSILLYKQTTTPSYYSTPDCIYDYFVDKVHGNEIDPKQGTYSMPASPGDEAKGDASCAEEHYHFMGWVEDVYVNRNGTLKSGYTLYPAGDTGHTAANKTFYAIWAAEE